MSALKLALLGAGVLGLAGVGLCMLGIAIAAQRLPDRPPSMPVNPLNILASKERWTPEIWWLNRMGVRCGVVFLAGVLLFALLTIVTS